MPKQNGSKPATKTAGKSLEDFQKAHDKSYIVPQKIRDGLKQLGEGWEYELDFIRRCQLSQTDIGLYRDQFEDFFIMLNGRNPKRCWSGSKATIQKMREMIGAS